MRLFLFILMSLTFCSSCSSPDDEEIYLTKQGLLDDLLFLKKEIIRVHPNPFHQTTEAEFESAVEQLTQNSSDYIVDEVFVKMLAITASVGDGHTNLRPFSYYTDYPIRFYWRQEHIYVSGTQREDEALLGSTLVAIDGTPIEDVIPKVFDLIPGHESEGFSRDWATYYFRVSQIMYGLGVSQSKERITYTFENAEGERTDLTLTVNSSRDDDEVVRPYPSAPHFHDAKEDGLWFREMEDGLIYFHFSDYPGERVFSKVGKELKKVLEGSTGKTLLIDLRRNGGGNFKKGRKLVDIIERTIADNSVPVYVATSSATYSAAVVNAVDFRDRLGATLVGEVTGGRPNGYQENSPFVLPNTRIPGSSSSEYYEFQEADTPGLFPDVQIDYTWEDYASGDDPVVAYLLDLRRTSAP